MNAKINKLMKSLKKTFPDCFFDYTENFDGTEGGIWTGLAECGEWDNYRVNPESKKLSDWLEKNDCIIEPYDAGTVMIFPTYDILDYI